MDFFSFSFSSILYADIVGFTQLASDCSPGELVHMLNELFGKFDQIAKVRNLIRSPHIQQSQVHLNRAGLSFNAERNTFHP